MGAGGLIRAYAGSVNHAIEAVGLVEFINQRELILNLDYSLYDSLQRFLIDQKKSKFRIVSFCRISK